MKEKIKKFINIIFGTQNNIITKVNCSFLISGILFLLIAITVKEYENLLIYKTFSCISAIFFSIWLSFISSNDTILGYFKELFRLFIFFIIFTFSLDFCINSSKDVTKFNLIIGSVISCCGIFACSFYIISKFIDIFVFAKRILIQIRERLFDTIQPSTSRAKSFIENITAFLAAIAGLSVAIKTIIEPIINIFNSL